MTDKAWLDARIAATKTQIENYEDAIAQLGSGAVQSYSLDTGQTRQSVTKLDLQGLQATVDSLYNRLDILRNRRYGTGVTTMRPDF